MSIVRNDGSWNLDLGGICYRELYELGRFLAKLGAKGNVDGTEFDLDTLHAEFNPHTGDVDLYDLEGNATYDVNEEDE